jgi:UDP:flavonoid glycosyltransferase YjiC (YdhE family)
MRYLVPTIGTRGDVQPYIALASSLQDAGHRATVATHPCWRGLVEAYGVPFASVGPDIDIGHEAAVIRARAPHWIVGLIRVMRFTFGILEQSHADVLALCRRTDVVIVSHTAAGSIEADKLCLPKVSVTLFPQAVPVRDPSEPLLRRTISMLAGWGMGLVMRRPLDRIRKRAGVPPMGPEGITSSRLNLLPISPHVCPPDPRWEAHHRITGYWFTEPPQAWTPPNDLCTFLEEGDPPVVVSLGAMSLGGADMLETARLTLAALQRVGARAIIQGWDKATISSPPPPTIYHTGSVPHAWLLPQTCCIVHHGGFGTTAATFRAGIPAVVVPHILDQFFWGQRVFELGVGQRPIPRAKLSVDNLSRALIRATQDDAMRVSAADLGAKIRAETGAQNAVQVIENAIRN